LRRVLSMALVLGSLAVPEAAQANSVPVSSKYLTTYMSCTLSGTIAASTSMRDAYVDQNAPTTNNGGAATMSVSSRASRNRHAYVIFDLTTCSPQIPSTARAIGATLRLWVTAMPTACRTQDVFAVGASWTETGITWNNQPFGTAINNPASGTRTDAITVGSGGGCTVGSTGRYVPWNVTADVAKFVAGTSTNNGWMIRDDAEDSGTAQTVTYASSDAVSVPQAPQLVVTYAR
jgi:hypothetical protein